MYGTRRVTGQRWATVLCAHAHLRTHMHTHEHTRFRTYLQALRITLNPKPKPQSPRHKTPHIPPDPPPHGMAQTSRRCSSVSRASTSMFAGCKNQPLEYWRGCGAVDTGAEAPGGGAPNGPHGHPRASKHTAAAVCRCAPPPVCLARCSKVSVSLRSA